MSHDGTNSSTAAITASTASAFVEFISEVVGSDASLDGASAEELAAQLREGGPVEARWALTLCFSDPAHFERLTDDDLLAHWETFRDGAAPQPTRTSAPSTTAVAVAVPESAVSALQGMRSEPGSGRFLNFYRGASTITFGGDAMTVQELAAELPVQTLSDLLKHLTPRLAIALFPVRLDTDTARTAAEEALFVAPAELYFARRDRTVGQNVALTAQCVLSVLGLEVQDTATKTIVYEGPRAERGHLSAPLVRELLRRVERTLSSLDGSAERLGSGLLEFIDEF